MQKNDHNIIYITYVVVIEISQQFSALLCVTDNGLAASPAPLAPKYHTTAAFPGCLSDVFEENCIEAQGLTR